MTMIAFAGRPFSNSNFLLLSYTRTSSAERVTRRATDVMMDKFQHARERAVGK